MSEPAEDTSGFFNGILHGCPTNISGIQNQACLNQMSTSAGVWPCYIPEPWEDAKTLEPDTRMV